LKDFVESNYEAKDTAKDTESFEKDTTAIVGCDGARVELLLQ
jgi:hypothetical protein